MFPTGPGGQPLPEVFFTMLYIAMLIIVVQGLVMYPPRLRPRKSAPAPDGTTAAVPALS
jgi:hypothetical protein